MRRGRRRRAKGRKISAKRESRGRKRLAKKNGGENEKPRTKDEEL